MKIIKYLLLILAIALSVGFSGCSDGGSSSSTSPTTTDYTISISGTAVDGYISGATACLDLDSSGTCDSSEPTTTTAADGTFSFDDVSVPANALFPVIVSGGTDTATGKAFTGQLKNIVDSATITAGTPLNVTPLTDLIATSFLQSSTKDITALNSSKAEIAEAFGLTVTDVVADPMTNIAVFAKTQEIQQIKALIETTATKALANGSTLTQAEKDKLLEDIKESLVAQIKESTGSTLDIDKVLAKVETKASITIPDNEKIFISAQVVQVKNILDTLSTTSTTTDELDELQAGLELEQDVANERLEASTADEIIEVVIISDIATLIQAEAGNDQTVSATAPVTLDGSLSANAKAAADAQPVAEAGDDQTVSTTATVTLDGSLSANVNSDTLTYLWSITSQPDGSSATLSDTTAVRPTFTADKDGYYELSLVASYGSISSGPDTVFITATVPAVKDNSALTPPPLPPTTLQG